MKDYSRLKYYGATFSPSVRTVKDMSKVLYDKEWLSQANPKLILYYMFREVYRSKEDLKKWRKLDMRYDITIIPSLKLGKEFNKTLGHGHPCPKGNCLSYPEIYELLQGNAHFLFQKPDGSDVIVIKAKEGDVVLVPPGYEHITINTSEKDIKMANVTANFTSDYSNILSRCGGAYFCLSDGSWVKNKRYKRVSRINYMEPTRDFSSDIYNLFKVPGGLDFLRFPEKAMEIFKKKSD